jgi:hypothetical protein
MRETKGSKKKPNENKSNKTKAKTSRVSGRFRKYV